MIRESALRFVYLLMEYWHESEGEEGLEDLFREPSEEEPTEDLEALLPPPHAPPTEASSNSPVPSLLLALPSEMAAHVASFLSLTQLRPLRLSCRALSRTTDPRMMARLQLSTDRIAVQSRAYVNLQPAWSETVQELRLSEQLSSGYSHRRLLRLEPWQSVPHGCAPICLWLLMFGPGLGRLRDVKLHFLPYMLEAVLVLRWGDTGCTGGKGDGMG